jgi:tRNA(Ile)-lysidine synthase
MDAATEIATRLEIPHRVVAAPPSGPSETELREARILVLMQAVSGDETVLTGHTLDDQAETVLGNIVRGAGTTGIAGIPTDRPGFARPMLGILRSTVRAVAQELGLPFRDDPMNADPEIRRNQLRLHTIPELAERYNPRFIEALGRLGSNAAEDDAVLEARARQVPITSQDSAVLVPAASLEMLPAPVSARVARRALRMINGPHPGSSAEVEAVLAAVTGATSTIAGGIAVSREGPWVVLVKDAVHQPPVDVLLETGTADFGPWRFESEPSSWALGRYSTVVPTLSGLRVRGPQPSDRIGIGDGTKAVSAALAEARVPARLRPHWPLVEGDGTILWIPGVRAVPGSVASGVRISARRYR